MLYPPTEIDCLASLHKRLAEQGLVYGSSGNASFFDRKHRMVWIKSSGCRCGDVQLDNLVPVFFDTHQPAREGLKPSSDTQLHMAVYANSPSANWVVHTHSAFAAAYSISGRSLPAYVSGTAEMFGTHIPCIPFATDREQLARCLDRELTDGTRACLLERHGPLVWGERADTALAAAETLEWSAQIALLAMTHGLHAMQPRHVQMYRSWYKRHYGQHTN